MTIRPSLRPLLLLAVGACDAPAPPGSSAVDTAPAESCAAWTYDRAPLTWALPTDVPAGTFAGIDRSVADCGASAPSGGLAVTRLLDLTGDGRPDLVALSSCDDPAVGTTAWRVWPAEDGGFGAALTWSLPAGYDIGAFAGLRAAASCAPDEGGALPGFRLDDLDGDGRLDLAVTDGCGDAELAGAWRVHLNSGAGFLPGELRPISTAFSAGAFATPRAVACAGDANVPGWGLADLDGSGTADIVVTDTCGGVDVGYTRWDVYTSGADGFSPAPRPWAVPPALLATALGRAGEDCFALTYFLLDLAGSGRPDLVVPYNCTQTGHAWSVYPNDGGGFASVPQLRTPGWGSAFRVDAPRRVSPACPLPAWELDDMDGDGDADLTVTAGCNDLGVGDTRWDVYAGIVGGWAEAVPLTLPTGYSEKSFSGGRSASVACGGTTSRPAWERRDLDGDGVPELVVTDVCEDAAVGVDAWRVYRMACAAP